MPTSKRRWRRYRSATTVNPPSCSPMPMQWWRATAISGSPSTRRQPLPRSWPQVDPILSPASSSPGLGPSSSPRGRADLQLRSRSCPGDARRAPRHPAHRTSGARSGLPRREPAPRPRGARSHIRHRRRGGVAAGGGSGSPGVGRRHLDRDPHSRLEPGSEGGGDQGAPGHGRRSWSSRSDHNRAGSAPRSPEAGFVRVSVTR